ncbi:MAG: diphthine--ammonia ligase [Candidatus Natronoplasma sp.]
MSYAVLYSGGKDSSLALWEARKAGLEIEYLVTVFPEREDSYMFHKPNLHLIPKLADEINLELVKIHSSGEKEKEVNDLKEGMKKLDIEGIITGAVASTYQLNRIEELGRDLSLDIYAPLWNMKQSALLEELLDQGFRTLIVSISARGLTEDWLGREIDDGCVKDLKELEKKYGINISGEGGEYESLVMDAPFYRKGFRPQEKEKFWDGKRGILVIEKMKSV